MPTLLLSCQRAENVVSPLCTIKCPSLSLRHWSPHYTPFYAVGMSEASGRFMVHIMVERLCDLVNVRISPDVKIFENVSRSTDVIPRIV